MPAQRRKRLPDVPLLWSAFRYARGQPIMALSRIAELAVCGPSAYGNFPPKIAVKQIQPC